MAEHCKVIHVIGVLCAALRGSRRLALGALMMHSSGHCVQAAHSGRYRWLDSSDTCLNYFELYKGKSTVLTFLFVGISPSFFLSFHAQRLGVRVERLSGRNRILSLF